MVEGLLRFVPSGLRRNLCSPEKSISYKEEKRRGEVKKWRERGDGGRWGGDGEEMGRRWGGDGGK